MRKIRTYQEVTHETESGLLEQVLEQQEKLAERLSQVKSVAAIASGKGGVGKSAVAANLAVTLAKKGLRVAKNCIFFRNQVQIQNSASHLLLAYTLGVFWPNLG